MKKFLSLPQDKANHFVYGFLIYEVTNLFLIDLASLAVVALFAVGTEIIDSREEDNYFSFADIAFTLAPGVISTLSHLI